MKTWAHELRKILDFSWKSGNLDQLYPYIWSSSETLFARWKFGDPLRAIFRTSGGHFWPAGHQFDMTGLGRRET